MPGCGADGHVEAAWGANRLLHEVGERPGAADVGGVGGIVREGAVVGGVRLGGLVEQIVDVDVGVCRVRWKAEQDGEEGVLEQHGLPEFAALIFLEGGGFGLGDVGIAVEAHGVGLAHEDACESPAVGGVVVVDEEVDHEDHGLDGADGGDGEVRGQAEGLVGGGGVGFRGVALAAGEFGVGGDLELRGDAVDDKQEGDEGRVEGTACFDGQGPELLVFVPEALAVEHGVDGIDAVKVEGYKDVACLPVGHHHDDLVYAPVIGPDIRKGVGTRDTKDVGACCHRVRNI